MADDASAGRLAGGDDERACPAAGVAASAAQALKTEGPTLLNPGVGDDAEDSLLEELDWGSIHDEDGALGRLSQAGGFEEEDLEVAGQEDSAAGQDLLTATLSIAAERMQTITASLHGAGHADQRGNDKGKAAIEESAPACLYLADDEATVDPPDRGDSNGADPSLSLRGGRNAHRSVEATGGGGSSRRAAPMRGIHEGDPPHSEKTASDTAIDGDGSHDGDRQLIKMPTAAGAQPPAGKQGVSLCSAMEARGLSKMKHL